MKVVAGIDHLQGEGDAAGAVFDYFAPLGGSVGASWTAWERGSDRLRLFANYTNSRPVSSTRLASDCWRWPRCSTSGSRFLNKRNTALAPGYTTLAAALGWRFKRYEVRADGTNLTDRRDPVAESELGDAQYYRLHARRIEATASVRFCSEARRLELTRFRRQSRYAATLAAACCRSKSIGLT